MLVAPDQANPLTLADLPGSVRWASSAYAYRAGIAPYAIRAPGRTSALFCDQAEWVIRRGCDVASASGAVVPGHTSAATKLPDCDLDGVTGWPA